MKKRGRKKLLKSIGPKLKRLRTSLGQTQVQTALRIGIELNNYCKIERMERLPDITTLIRIADAYGVSTDWILSRTRKKPMEEEEDVPEVEQEQAVSIVEWPDQPKEAPL